MKVLRNKRFGFKIFSRVYLGLALASLGVTVLLSPALVNTSKIFLKSGDSTVKESRNLMGINLARVNTSSLTSTSLANPRSRRLGEPAPQVLPLIPIAIGIAIGLISISAAAVLFATAYRIATDDSLKIRFKFGDLEIIIESGNHSEAMKKLESIKEDLKHFDSSLEALDKLVEKISDKSEKKDAIDKMFAIRDDQIKFVSLVSTMEETLSKAVAKVNF